MFCIHCGNPVSENSNFCMKCGKSVHNYLAAEGQPSASLQQFLPTREQQPARNSVSAPLNQPSAANLTIASVSAAGVIAIIFNLFLSCVPFVKLFVLDLWLYEDEFSMFGVMKLILVISETARDSGIDLAEFSGNPIVSFFLLFIILSFLFGILGIVFNIASVFSFCTTERKHFWNYCSSAAGSFLVSLIGFGLLLWLSKYALQHAISEILDISFKYDMFMVNGFYIFLLIISITLGIFCNIKYNQDRHIRIQIKNNIASNKLRSNG